MRRYFFNFVGSNYLLLDKEGVELADVATVREYARRRAAELKGEAHKIENLSALEIQICGEDGEQILNLFSESDLRHMIEPIEPELNPSKGV